MLHYWIFELFFFLEKYREEFNFDKFYKENGYRCNRSAFAPPKRLANFMRRRPRSAESRKPEWKKYWSTNSIPDIIEPPNHGAFRETALQAPLEARDLRRYPYACECFQTFENSFFNSIFTTVIIHVIWKLKCLTTCTCIKQDLM